MFRRRLLSFIGFGAMCVMASLLSLQMEASGQGRGRGGGASHGGGRGNPGGGPPSGVGIDGGIGNSSEMSRGRSDTGRAVASERSNGRYDMGVERARLRSENARRADDELRDHPGMPTRLHTTANDLRNGYRRALVTNPELKFGEYVAASRLAANLRGSHAGVTRDAILAGLARGSSLGRTLRDLGLSKDESRDARRRVDKEIKESNRR